MEEQPKQFELQELSKLHGPIDIPLTNDYLFRALLQKNNQVLKAILCALLHLNPEQVKKVSVENPIELGKSYEEKDFILDIKALLDDNLITNLEMQVINEHNWLDRSLSYLCRSFDHLNNGDAYTQAKPAIQIGFLNFTLFPEHPEFYATYSMMNEKTYQKYSDKLRLIVVDLTQIKLATKEDRVYGIDQWAKFFKCKDWSELVMLAKENSDIQAAVGTVYQLSRDEKIRQQCEAREDYYRRELDRQLQNEHMEKTKQEIALNLKKLLLGRKELAQGQQELAQGQQELAQEQQNLAQGRQELAQEQQELAQEQQDLTQGQQELAKEQQSLAQKQKELIQKQQDLALEKHKIEESKKMLHEWELAIEKKIQTLEKLSENESN